MLRASCVSRYRAPTLISGSVNFRRTNVATKIKITYIKDSVLDVGTTFCRRASLFKNFCSTSRLNCNIKHVSSSLGGRMTPSNLLLQGTTGQIASALMVSRYPPLPSSG